MAKIISIDQATFSKSIQILYLSHFTYLQCSCLGSISLNLSTQQKCKSAAEQQVDELFPTDDL